jgi:UrcA family protein
MRKPIITLLAALAMTMTGTAHARPISASDGITDTVSETVKYSDLDLSSPEGMGTLNKRIDHAAAKVCAQAGADFSGYRACVAKARDDAMEQINAGPLAQLNLSNPFEGLEFASIF